MSAEHHRQNKVQLKEKRFNLLYTGWPRYSCYHFKLFMLKQGILIELHTNQHIILEESDSGYNSAKDQHTNITVLRGRGQLVKRESPNFW